MLHSKTAVKKPLSTVSQDRKGFKSFPINKLFYYFLLVGEAVYQHSVLTVVILEK